MANNLSSILKRRKTIKTTQKITNAMKLVSISKLQMYKVLYSNYLNILSVVDQIDSENIHDEREKLYVVFFPDMGLVSNFTKRLKQFIKHNQLTPLYVIGSKGIELFKHDGFNVINEPINSEHLDINRLIEISEVYGELYNICVVTPEFTDNDLVFKVISTQKVLKKKYDLLHEPHYETSNRAYQATLTKVQLVKAYYLSKISEYTMRHIAMEKATESANDMLQDLKLQYNRLRQESITAEILDLTPEEY